MNPRGEPEPLDNDFIEYIARRQGVDIDEARARLSEWLYLYFLSEGSRLRQRGVQGAAATCAFSASSPDPR